MASELKHLMVEPDNRIGNVMVHLSVRGCALYAPILLSMTSYIFMSPRLHGTDSTST